MTIQFDDQVVIVTGAGGGLGRAHALEFARRGAIVVVNDIGGAVDGSSVEQVPADAVVAEIEALGGRAVADRTSVTDNDGVKALVANTLDQFGRIDVLVNNAGILRDKTFRKMPLEDFQAVVDVHLTGSVNMTQAVWPAMVEQNYGRIIMTSSSTGLYGNFGQSNYGAAKLALVGLVNTLKHEGEKYNIRCNALAPVAYTRMTAGLLPDEADEILIPERVSPAVIYLAGTDAPNGIILAAGAGGFAKVEIVESAGCYLGADATAEDIQNNWEGIADMSEAQALNVGREQTLKFIALARAGNKS